MRFAKAESVRKRAPFREPSGLTHGSRICLVIYPAVSIEPLFRK